MLYINEIIDYLDNTSTILDAGCGGGSFDYKNSNLRVIGVDLNFPENDKKTNDLKNLNNVHFVKCDCMYLPFKSHVFNALIYNHTLEHFSDVENCIKEGFRVSQTDSYLYVAVPDGYCFDDRFYRWLSRGGGHVNRFTFNSICEKIFEYSDFKLSSFGELNSGFTYLSPPKEAHKHFTHMHIKYFMSETLQRILIWITRISDRVFHTNLKLYGYVLLFSKKETEVIKRNGYINVCRKCGSGFNSELNNMIIKRNLFFHQYICPSCGTINEFYKE